MKFGQIIEYFFFESHAENKVERLVQKLFLFFKKIYMK